MIEESAHPPFPIQSHPMPGKNKKRRKKEKKVACPQKEKEESWGTP